MSKLDLGPMDRLLEIGCGVGNLLIPLSFMVKQAYGIDHPEVVESLRKRFSDPNLILTGSNFFDYQAKINENYEKILINSALALLPDEDRAILFIEKAANLLSPGGKLLLGDIANIDKKKRFLNTKFGHEFNQKWETQVGSIDGGEEDKQAATIFKNVNPSLVPSDKFILKLIRRFRRPGWEAYSLPQPDNLPFGYTREDLLVVRLLD